MIYTFSVCYIKEIYLNMPPRQKSHLHFMTMVSHFNLFQGGPGLPGNKGPIGPPVSIPNNIDKSFLYTNINVIVDFLVSYVSYLISK